ncbi:hypothetical protein QFC22_006224 [Naganishia vaughanmartiniae]|uniref:Uncharacterized protein n=1 Tax=Naganishia vaughanmartiniae TaxID=1424756 RepID=A0ACC2WNT8_9TREE|nr:hypothetical protein QFC22_006224 [Naganishia vaughanmartiniae]
MRSSTILLLTLRALSQETIKNLVLAGVGRLIVMDDQHVSEQDLGAGLLFREEDGDVGKKRVTAALPQIKSLNPLVKITPLPTLAPFITSATSSDLSTEQPAEKETMEEFLKREKVDLVCATDLTMQEMGRINTACRATNTLFYGAGSYGYLGWIFNDLGEKYEWVTTSQTTSSAAAAQSKTLKKQVSYTPFSEAFSSGSNPFEGMKRNETREKLPALVLGVLSIWEYQSAHAGKLPNSSAAEPELMQLAEKKRLEFGVNEKAMKSMPEDLITYAFPSSALSLPLPPLTAGQLITRPSLSHLAITAPYEFAPTAAILGGLLAQDILRALSRREKPVMNFLCVDTMAGNGAVTKWGVKEESDV